MAGFPDLYSVMAETDSLSFSELASCGQRQADACDFSANKVKEIAAKLLDYQEAAEILPSQQMVSFQLPQHDFEAKVKPQKYVSSNFLKLNIPFQVLNINLSCLRS